MRRAIHPLCAPSCALRSLSLTLSLKPVCRCAVTLVSPPSAHTAVTTSVDHEELWTEHNAMLTSLPEGMLVFDVSLGSALAPEKKQHHRKR